jgi:hypothetical protein
MSILGAEGVKNLNLSRKKEGNNSGSIFTKKFASRDRGGSFKKTSKSPASG